MDAALLSAGLLAIGVGVAHSVLGERFIIGRLLRRADLPTLFGSDVFTRRTLRFAWHLTTLAFVGMGALLLALAGQDMDMGGRVAVRFVGATFGACTALTVVASRGRHLAWIVFAAIAGLTWYGAA